MGLKDIDIKLSYAGKGNKILNAFLLPAIKESLYYDRITSFYTIDSLLAISQGIQSIYDAEGKMRLIIGIHSFPSELVDASLRQQYLKDEIDKVRSQIKNDIISLTDALQKERLATLAWMIYDGLLEVKAAAVEGDGIFHPKTLILTDAEDNKVVAIGSPNETVSGLGGNFEQLAVTKSWPTQENIEAVEVHQQFFEGLWNNEDEDAVVSDISEETATLIKEALGAELFNKFRKKTGTGCKDIIGTAAEMPVNFFVSGQIPALYMHQERAVIDALSRWPVRVLFSDEVGLGKTFEVAATMVFLIKYCGVKKVVILTPKSVLQQWQDELYEHFKIDAWRYDSTSRCYLNNTGRRRGIGHKNPLGKLAPDIVLMSAQYARGSGKDGGIFSLEDTVLPDLLVVDEAHSARISRGLAGGKHKTRMYSMLEKVSTEIPHLILATATPMQKDADEYHAMLRLLGLPKQWKKERNYQTSLKLIAADDAPDASDAFNAAQLLAQTLTTMSPGLGELAEAEIEAVEGLMQVRESGDNLQIGNYVQDHWEDIRPAFIKLHPAHLLTVRNTRRSLTDVGYKFPKRNLNEVSVDEDYTIKMFYADVNDYLTHQCFKIEQELYPDRKISIGFVRVSYQQRVASSLYSCIKSLERRAEKVEKVKAAIEKHKAITAEYGHVFDLGMILDDIDMDELLDTDSEDGADFDLASVDLSALQRAVGIEATALSSLIKRAKELLESCGDMKIRQSVELALDCLEEGDSVLLFSRYTDTIEALLDEFRQLGGPKKYTYGIYTGEKSVIIEDGHEEKCDKSMIKKELFAGRLRVMFCSDAASEGLNLQAARVLINVDVPWTPARLEQRVGRIARLGQMADEVDIYNVWYPDSIEAKMYHRIQKRLKETNLAIGEFPEVVAANIRLAVLEDKEEDDSALKQLNEIRNSSQVKALERLWSASEISMTSSASIRQQLMDLCEKAFDVVDESANEMIKTYKMPDGSTIPLTMIDGMSETISLASRPWDFVQYMDDDLIVIRDGMDRPAAFAESGAPEELLSTETVFGKLTGGATEGDIYEDAYPHMLPDDKDLDLSFAVGCEILERPVLWIDE